MVSVLLKAILYLFTMYNVQIPFICFERYFSWVASLVLVFFLFFSLSCFLLLISVLQSFHRNSIQTKNLLELCNSIVAYAKSFNLQNQCQIFSIRCKRTYTQAKHAASLRLNVAVIHLFSACSLLVFTLFLLWTFFSRWNAGKLGLSYGDFLFTLYSSHWTIAVERCSLPREYAIIFFLHKITMPPAAIHIHQRQNASCFRIECRLLHMWKFNNVLRIVSQHHNVNVNTYAKPNLLVYQTCAFLMNRQN